MDCPFCGKEMREGRIPSRDHLKWYDSASEDIWPKGIRLSESSNVQAFFCPDCRQIVLHVPEVEGLWDKMQKKLDAASVKIGAMQKQWEARCTQAENRKKKEKSGTKDPWEL